MIGVPYCIGKILCSSESKPTDATDWALVMLTEKCMKDLSNPSNTGKSKDKHATLPKPYPTTIARKLEKSTEILLSTADNTSDEGTLSISEASVCLPGSRTCSSFPTLSLKRNVRLGDCGGWIIDHNGNWYGQIIAGIPGSSIAYIVAASNIVAAIETATATTVTLVPGSKTDNYTAVSSLSQPDAQHESLYTRALCLMAKAGKEVVVQLLLDMGVSIRARDALYGIVLPAASAADHEKTVKMLLGQGADVNARNLEGETVLDLALSRDQVPVVETLIDHIERSQALDTTSYKTRFHSEGGRDEPEPISEIIRIRQASTNRYAVQENSLHSAAFNGDESTVLRLLGEGAYANAEDRSGSTALRVASEHGYEAIVRPLVDYGVGIDARDALDKTALFLASCNGHASVVQMLLEEEADVGIRDLLGESALQVATTGGHEEVAQLLLAFGADADARDMSNATILHTASSRGHGGIVKLYLDRGLDINAQDNLGRTPLLKASSLGHKGIVQILLKYQADVNVEDVDKITALAAAKSNGHDEVVRMLLEHGARSSSGPTSSTSQSSLSPKRKSGLQTVASSSLSESEKERELRLHIQERRLQQMKQDLDIRRRRGGPASGMDHIHSRM